MHLDEYGMDYALIPHISKCIGADMTNGEFIMPFKDFIHGEIRYSSLMNVFPEIAGEMFNTAEENAKERYENYKRLAEMKFGES
jgi:hypothetical protein